MALPLLGLLLGGGALAGGALSQEYWLDRQAREAQAGVDRLMGSAPEQLGADVAGPPRPGTGLMADPADPRKQLEFARGMMGLGWREKNIGTAMLDSIMGRASQAGLTREGWGVQAGQNQLSREQSAAQFNQTDARLVSQFDQQMAQSQAQFEQTRKERGDEVAFTQKMAREANARAWLENARQQSAERRAVEKAQRAGELPKLSADWEHVLLKGPDGQPVIGARPVRGSTPWQKGADDMDQLFIARDNIEKLKTSISQPSGTEHFGAKAGEQAQLWSRIVASMGKLDMLGTLQEGDLKRLQGELANPTEFFRRPVSVARLNASLGGLAQQFQTRQELLVERTQAWGIPVRSPGAPGAAPGAAPGRDAPPPGSLPLGDGRPNSTQRRGTRLLLPPQLMEPQ